MIKKKILSRIDFEVFVSEDEYNKKERALVKFQKSLKVAETPLADDRSSK
jgi:hypothetical protein